MVSSDYFTKFHDFSMIIQVFSNSMTFPCMELFLVIVHDFQSLWEPCHIHHHHQGGQSHGQHDWVHRFPEPVKSFITFVIPSQISCSKVQKKIIIFCTRLCQSFSLVCCSFPDYLDQLREKRKILRHWAHTSVGQSNLENCSEPRRNFTQFCAEKYEVFFTLYRMKFDLV